MNLRSFFLGISSFQMRQCCCSVFLIFTCFYGLSAKGYSSPIPAPAVPLYSAPLSKNVCFISLMVLNFGGIVMCGSTTSTKLSKALVECSQKFLPSVIKRMRILILTRK